MRLKLAPQIIQSIEILQLPMLELRERIEQELLENPLLEVVADQEDDPAAELEEPAETEAEPESDEPEIAEGLEAEPETEPEPIEDENYDALEDLIPSPSAELYEPGRRSSYDEEDPKRAAIENSPAPEVTLEEHLAEQLALLDLGPELLRTCENIIANLDWRGYLEHPLEEIAASMDGEVTLQLAEDALRVVQRLDPKGVGARDLAECLVLQLDPDAEDYAFLSRLARDHFADIVENRYPQVARAMDCTMEELKVGVDQIAELNPMPGALFGHGAAPRVSPDVTVELVEGEYRVTLEDADLPSLGICGYYARRLQRADLDEKTREYLRDKLMGARWLIDAIQQRRSTVFNITSAVVEEQREFLDKGSMHLKPLKMQEIADKVGVHVSTVSRAISGKYVQTPQGIYPLRGFFTGGVERDDGEMESWEVVRQKLQQIVDHEDKKDPLSDQQLADTLAEQGIEIARRTVSKYRKVLGIPSSRRRKEY